MQLCKQDEGQTDDIKLKSTPQRNPEDPQDGKGQRSISVSIQYLYHVTLTSWILTQQPVKSMSRVILHMEMETSLCGPEHSKISVSYIVGGSLELKQLFDVAMR